MTWLIVVPILIAVAAVVIFNGLVGARQRTREAWSAIDVQLQRRASLIPNLVEVVRGYAGYERDTLKRIVDARGQLGQAAGPRAAAQANDTLTSALQSFFALAEAYPNLKANERFAQLQADLADSENKIAFARNYYNGAVEIYNIKVQRFPDLLMARAMGFAPAEFFSADAGAAAPIDARL
jgi:LemA protein